MIKAGFIITESIRDWINWKAFKYLPLPQVLNHDEQHLHAAIQWLINAGQHGGGGVASHYHLLTGRWGKPFPETTGYIIPTLFDYFHFAHNEKCYDLAISLSDWLGSVQMKDGGCIQGCFDQKRMPFKPIVFNTGQNLLGFLRTFQETGQQKYAQLAIRAGDFLVHSTDERGIWNQNLHRHLQHTINARSAWALLALHQQVPQNRYQSVALANLDWTVAQQTANGWFEHGASRPHQLPSTHFISYTCEGLIQSYLICGEKRYLTAAIKTAEKMLRIFEVRKMLHTLWDSGWRNRGRYWRHGKGRSTCLTGNAQLALVWLWLFEITGDIRYANSAFKMLDYLKSLQRLEGKNPGIVGGIKGSFPVYGAYAIWSYPNWAAKFFADALLAKIKIRDQLLKSYQTFS